MPIVNEAQLMGMHGIGDFFGNVAKSAVRNVFTSVEIKSALSKPVVYTGGDLANMISTSGNPVPPTGGPGAKDVPQTPPPSGSTEPIFSTKSLIERVKPTMVVNTVDGSRLIFAPYGEATDTEWKPNVTKLVIGSLGILLLYTAGAYYLGFKAGQRKAAR